MEHKTLIENVLGIDDESFFDKYWEKQHYESSAALPPERFKSFFNLADLETLLHDGLLTAQNVRLASAKGNPPASAYTHEDGRIQNDKLYYFFNLGSTIVLRNAELYFPNVNELGNHFRNGGPFFKKFFVNLYLTPKDSQGFVTHFDTQEVFIVQVLGAKKWSLYTPSLGLPLEDVTIPIENTGSTVASIMLETGKALYIPRGIYHDAQTSDQVSCHLTFSYVPVTKYDVLKLGLQHRAMTSLDLRKSFFEKDVQGLSNSSLTFPEKVPAIDQIVQRKKTQFPGFIGRLSNVSTITSDSWVKRSRFEFQIGEEGNEAYCLFDKMRYRFPLESSVLLEFFQKNPDTVQVSLLATPFDPEGTELILSKLVSIGYIEVVKPQFNKR